MKIAIAQQNYLIGDFEGNFQKMENAIANAITEKTDLIVFSELSVCGYPPRDFLEFKHFINLCDKTIEKLCIISTKNIAIIVGSPSRNPSKKGKDLFNSAYLIFDGKVQHIANKALLPTYDVFDEYRYFESNTIFEIANFKDKKIAITICEDIWDIGLENPLYPINPMEELSKQNPDIIINISASPFSYNHTNERLDIVKLNATTYKIPIFYINCIGAQTELIFDGGSLVVDAKGNVIDELKYFEEDYKTYEINSDNSIVSSEFYATQNYSKIQLIHDALVCGIKDYFLKLGFTKAILGLSGGVDSALTLVLAVRALGTDNVLSVLMPSQYSTSHSVGDSEKLVANLHSPSKIIPIKEPFDVFINILEPHFENKPFNVTEENIQARVRAIYLMALSNKHGFVLLNTTNKSEAAVGYGTLYGDMCGGLAVLADLYKTQIYELCNYINKDEEIIPKNILTKAPSAELRPGQKDSDSLPDYAILDKILYQYIENRQGPDEIEKLGFDEALITRILRMVNRNEFKRHQTPPILRVSHKAFGSGRRLPIVGKYLEA